MNTNPTYQQELLRKYIDGSISTDERHLLEKMALDDPFLFDAMEGVHANKETALDKIQEVYTSFGESPKKKRRIIPWRWMSVAAGIVLVAAIGFLIRPDQQNESNKSMAHAEYEASADTDDFEGVNIGDSNGSTYAGAIDSVTSEPVILEEDKALSTKAISGDERMQNGNKEILKEERTAIYDEELVALESISIEANSDDSIISIRGSRGEATAVYVDGVRVSQSSIPQEDKTQSNSPIAESKEKSHSSNQVSPPNPEEIIEEMEVIELENMPTNAVLSEISNEDVLKRKKENPRASDGDMASEDHVVSMIEIKGKVMDERGEVLIGANVLDIQNNLGTVANIDGEFSLSVPKNTSFITIAYTGFTSQDVILDGSPSYDIIMEEGALLDEVVVVQNSGAKILRSHLLNSRPMQGHEFFLEYIKDNIILPEGCEGGYVTLSFKINTNGNLEKIEVLDATHTACVSEAIRLLKNGGKWITTPPRQSLYTEYNMKMSY